MKKLRSSVAATASAIGWKKLGQPVPLSNFASEANSACPQPAHTNVPLPYSLSSGLEPARSVPCSRSTRYCSGVSARRHSPSLLATGKLSSSLLRRLNMILDPPGRAPPQERLGLRWAEINCSAAAAGAPRLVGKSELGSGSSFRASHADHAPSRLSSRPAAGRGQL